MIYISRDCITNIYIVCGKNQEWNDCGSACPAKCSDSDHETSICTHQCVAGCFCINGYKLDDDGKCIDEDKCPIIKDGKYYESP